MKWDEKKKIRALDVDKLRERLGELERLKMKMETKLHFDGKLNRRVSYDVWRHEITNESWGGGNLKKLRHLIAFVRGVLHEKDVSV